MEDLLTKSSELLRNLRSTYDKYANNGNCLVLSTPRSSTSSRAIPEISEDQKYIEYILKNHKTDPIKGFDNVLWRIEIDVENVEDLVNNQ